MNGEMGGDIYKISKIKHYLPCMIPRIDQTPCGGPSQIPKNIKNRSYKKKIMGLNEVRKWIL